MAQTPRNLTASASAYERVAETVIDQAARWHARYSSQRMDSSDWRQFDTWCGEASENRRAFSAMARISRLSSVLGIEDGKAMVRNTSPGLVRTLEQNADIAPSATPRFRRIGLYRAAGAVLLLAPAIPILYFVAMDDSTSAAYSQYHTASAERRTVELPDGTEMTLNAASEVTLRISDRERHLRLNHGEIYLDVSHDPARPFRVEVDAYRVTVVGTAFDLRKRNGAAQLTVDEGRVVVSKAGTGSVVTVLEVDAGQTLLLKPGEYPVEFSKKDAALMSSWREGWLHFHDRRLDTIMQEFEPYLGKDVVIEGSGTAALRVSGSFDVDRLDSALESMASLLPIGIIHEDDRIVVRAMED